MFDFKMSGRHLFLNKGGDPRTFKIKYLLSNEI
jgi:hypothetical protein